MDDIRPNLPDEPTLFMDQLRVFIKSKQLAYKTEKLTAPGLLILFVTIICSIRRIWVVYSLISILAFWL
jgi:hypothetical protein